MSFTILFIALNFIHVCVGWWGSGHLIIAQLAHEELKSNPADKNLVDSLDALLNDTSVFFPNLSGFVDVATWADNLHDEFGTEMFGKWHFANNPFIEKSFNQSLPKPAPLTRESNVWSTLYYCNESLSHTDIFTAATKRNGKMWLGAWCLRWLVHVVGDVHQPLHVTDMYNNQFPGGDHGGNKCKVNFTDHPNVDNLHAFWDSGAGLYEKRLNIPLTKADREQLVNWTTQLRQTYPKSKLPNSTIDNLDFEKWIEDGYHIGIEHGYLNGSLECGTTSSNAVVLNNTYVDHAQDICQLRLVLAGYRLANLLRMIGPRHYKAVLPGYCRNLDNDPTHIRIDVPELIFIAIASGAGVFILFLTICAFCFGRMRGRRAGMGPSRCF